MHNYTITTPLKAIWARAVALYQQGHRNSAEYFTAEETRFLESIGATAQEVFDFAEDWVNREEPDFLTFALLAEIRRHYFQNQQGGHKSQNPLDPDTLPAKTDAVDGIEWLPRLIPKAKAKLRGELSPDIMYGCGGDRNFFRTHDIHPATFLRVVEAHETNDQAIIDWVKANSALAVGIRL